MDLGIIITRLGKPEDSIPQVPMQFEVVGNISKIETIAVSGSIRILSLLQKRYGKGRWRKLKGVATVRLNDGTIRYAEVHGLRLTG